jgi:hypothetical protein
MSLSGLISQLHDRSGTSQRFQTVSERLVRHLHQCTRLKQPCCNRPEINQQLGIPPHRAAEAGGRFGVVWRAMWHRNSWARPNSMRTDQSREQRRSYCRGCGQQLPPGLRSHFHKECLRLDKRERTRDQRRREEQRLSERLLKLCCPKCGARYADQ